MASEVVPAPTLTPSIGSGKASAAVAAASRPAMPATSAQVGGSATSDATAATIPTIASTATGITTGNDRTVSALSARGDHRNGGSLRHCLQRLLCGRLLAIPSELKLIASFRRPLPGFTTPLGSAEYDIETCQGKGPHARGIALSLRSSGGRHAAPERG